MFYGETDTMAIVDFYSYGQKYGLKMDIANKVRKSLKYVKVKLPIRRVIYDSNSQMREDSLTIGIPFWDTY